MPVEILMPALSPTMEEGTLARWLVAEGDAVKAGQVIAEIETDKATMEFEAADDGVLGRILVPAGTAGVKVNTPIALLLAEGEAPGPASAPAAAAAAGPFAAPGPKADPAPAGPARGAPQARAATTGRRILASPLARRLAAERGIDLAGLAGSGPHGRIVKADVEAAAAAGAAAAVPAAPAPASAAPAPAAPTRAAPAPEPRPALAPAAAAPAPGATADQVRRLYEGRNYEEVALDGMRRTVAARLTEAKQTIPHFYLRREVAIDRLLGLRAELNGRLEARGVKLSVNDFLIKACALALQEVPGANTVWAGDRMLRFKASDVAVAVAVEGGLFTPVIRDAHQKSLSVISAEMKDLAARARARKLAPQEYLGGSFAISNLGMYGIESFDAVINPPHGSILAVGAGVRRPVVGADGSIGAATVMGLTLSVDHRAIDGALAAEFLAAIVGHIAEPLGMLA